MRIIARRTLRQFWEAGHADAEQALKSWFAEVSRSQWSSMADIKKRYPHASVIDSERVVFNIRGNNYRLVVKVWFPGQACPQVPQFATSIAGTDSHPLAPSPSQSLKPLSQMQARLALQLS